MDNTLNERLDNIYNNLRQDSLIINKNFWYNTTENAQIKYLIDD